MKIASFHICERLAKLDYDGEYSYMCVKDAIGRRGYEHLHRINKFPQLKNVCVCAAPYLEEVADWLRENYHINIVVYYKHKYMEEGMCKCPWLYNLEFIGSDNYKGGHMLYGTYEESLESAIGHSLDIIEKKQDGIPTE